MVECGFSINKEMEVENMTGSTFAAKRMVSDHIHSVDGINNINVDNKQLLLYSVLCKCSTQIFSLPGRSEKCKMKGCCR